MLLKKVRPKWKNHMKEKVFSGRPYGVGTLEDQVFVSWFIIAHTLHRHLLGLCMTLTIQQFVALLQELPH